MSRVDPGATIELSLDEHDSLPAESRPVFLFRVMTMREWRKACSSQGHYVEAAFGVIESACVGWKNIDKPFSSDALQDELSPMEGLELFKKLSSVDKKKPESQP